MDCIYPFLIDGLWLTLCTSCLLSATLDRIEIKATSGASIVRSDYLIESGQLYYNCITASQFDFDFSKLKVCWVVCTVV